jgi:hypothetical protein
MDLKEVNVGRFGLGESGSGYGSVAGSCEHGNEHSYLLHGAGHYLES